MMKTLTLVLAVLVSSCAGPARYGMVEDPQTGMQFGSAIEKNIFVDSSQFANRTVKVTTRNVSGDRNYQLGGFEHDLARALQARGYAPTSSEKFGIRFDLNVLYSGHIQSNMTNQYAFLGAGAGGVAGYRSDTRAGTAAGALAGATIGSIIGSNVTDDTYIVVAEVSIGVTDAASAGSSTITFSSSPPMQRQSTGAVNPFREVLRTKIAVYAGGRNTAQSQVADEIRRRLVDIASNSL